MNENTIRQEHLRTAAEARVSVVIPCYNAAKFINQTLDSVYRQRLPALEVLVVNDGSPDSAQLELALQPYLPRVRYFRQDNRGPSAARNLGIRKARGEYIAFLDSDDYWLPEFLSEQIRLLKQDPSLDLVYADARCFGGTPQDGKTLMGLTPSRGEATFESLITLRCTVFTSCVVAKRQALLDAGLFDEQFFHSEDFDLWARLAHRGGRIGYQTLVLAHHRIHRGSLSAGRDMLIRGQIQVSKKLLGSLDLTRNQHALLERHIAWCEANLRLTASKQHLQDGDFMQAEEALREANSILRTRKLSAVGLALRCFPRLLRSVYLVRLGNTG